MTLSEAGSQRRARLGDYVPASFSASESMRTPLVPKQWIVETPLIGPMTVSLLVHAVILGWLFYKPPPHNGIAHEGTQSPVEMVFDAPPVQHSLRGPPSHDNGGGASAPSASQTLHESAPVHTSPSQEQPSSQVTPPSPSGELIKADHVQKSVTSATPRQEVKQRAASASRSVQHQATNNPFAHPMTLSWSGPPSPHARHRGRRGGTGGAVDLSVGPLSLNGQLNAPYQTRNHIKGVSSDYGAEIDRWIRNHMFYPDEAAQAGEDGPSSVHVVIDRTGHVLSVRLSEQSGSYSLDTATVGLFQGVSLPPVPPDMSGNHFDLDVTINYILIRQ